MPTDRWWGSPWTSFTILLNLGSLFRSIVQGEWEMDGQIHWNELCLSWTKFVQLLSWRSVFSNSTTGFLDSLGLEYIFKIATIMHISAFTSYHLINNIFLTFDRIKHAINSSLSFYAQPPPHTYTQLYIQSGHVFLALWYPEAVPEQ